MRKVFAEQIVQDEPSAYLDSEQRIIASRVIKRFILHSKKVSRLLRVKVWLIAITDRFHR